MKNSINRLIPALAILLCSSLIIPAMAQETEKKQDRPVRNMFESNWMIDNQTAIVPIKGTFEMDILHRFGPWDNGYDDLWGIFGPSNIKLGFTYVPVNKLQIGFGFTREKLLWDFNIKYVILQQNRSDKMPINLTYFGNTAIDTRDGSNFQKGGDRFSYFHQLMVARKFNDVFSFQAGLSLSHFNAVEAYINENDETVGRIENDHIAASFLGRLKVGDATSIIFNFDTPITDHNLDDPKANLSLGYEIISSSHAFQIFIGNFRGIVPQYNNVFNRNGFGESEYLLGFNMTRLWNF